MERGGSDRRAVKKRTNILGRRREAQHGENKNTLKKMGMTPLGKKKGRGHGLRATGRTSRNHEMSYREQDGVERKATKLPVKNLGGKMDKRKNRKQKEMGAYKAV